MMLAEVKQKRGALNNGDVLTNVNNVQIIKSENIYEKCFMY